jgi:hypothetical protein
MGQGIDMARADAPLHAEALDNFKDQLLIVLLKRLGPKVSISVEEMDDTGMDMASFNVIDGVFNFEVHRKS